MINKLHQGLTTDPGSTLPDGTPEIPLRGLLSGNYPLETVFAQLAYKHRRDRRKKMPAEKLRALRDMGSDTLLTELLALVREKKQTGPVVAVMAPWHEDPTLSTGEGYIRRVAETDGKTLSGFFCVYFYECPYHKVDRIVADRLSDTRIYIRYNTARDCQRRFVEALVSACDICYSHSVLRIIPFDEPGRQDRWPDIFSGGAWHLLDTHGVPVEESMLEGGGAATPAVIRAEELYFKHAGGIVVVTWNMRRYYSEKYPRSAATFFTVPFLGEDSANRTIGRERSAGLRVVYAGGCQTWQNIPLMQEAIRRTRSARYSIYVNEPEVFLALWGAEPVPDNVIIKRGSPREIQRTYSDAHYGFILRDDHIINRVACPAKLMEYIQFGVVPIMKFDAIGDLKTLGMKYLPVERFMAGDFPAELERAAMARANLDIVNRLKEEKAWLQLARSIARL